MIPATIAANPVHRMSFEGVIFILLSRVAEVSRLVFICVSPFRVAVCLIALVCSLVAIVFFSLLILSDTDTLNAFERGLELWSPILFLGPAHRLYMYQGQISFLSCLPQRESLTSDASAWSGLTRVTESNG